MGIFTNSIHPSNGEAVNQEGGIIAVKSLSYNTAVTSTNNIADDSSTPLQSEGVELFSVAHGLAVSTNKILFIFSVYGNEDTNLGDNCIYPLFAGSTCIFVGWHSASGQGVTYNWEHSSHTFLYSPGTTNSISYSLRGAINNGTFEHMDSQQYAANNYYGSNRKSVFTLMELSST